MPYHVLIIEDDRDIARLVKIHLRDTGYEVTVSHDGKEGFELVLAKSFDLIVLDLLLPGVDGMEICRRVRAHSAATPILMLTSRTSEIDRVLGLEIGADDYLTKPFGIRELLARVKALLRRVETLRSGTSGDPRNVVRAGGIVLDPERRSVTRNGDPVSLTAKEFDLLLQFAGHPGRVYTRSELLNLVWGYGFEGYEHTVNSHINRLRSKIEEDPSRPRYILSVRGVGYKFSEADDAGKG